MNPPAYVTIYRPLCRVNANRLAGAFLEAEDALSNTATPVFVRCPYECGNTYYFGGCLGRLCPFRLPTAYFRRYIMRHNSTCSAHVCRTRVWVVSELHDLSVETFAWYLQRESWIGYFG